MLVSLSLSATFPTGSRQKRSSAVMYTVELLLVIDYKEYLK